MTSAMEELLEDVCPDLPVCSCAGCGRMLVSEGARKRYRHYSAGIDVVFLRARGVPFCRGCSSDGEVRYVLQSRTRHPHEADPCITTPTPTTAPTRTPCESSSS